MSTSNPLVTPFWWRAMLAAAIVTGVLASARAAEPAETGAGEAREPAVPLVVPEHIAKRSTGDLDQVRKRRYLRALVSPNPTDFFFDGAQPAGLQVEWLREFEKWLNKGVKREAERVRIAYIPVPFADLIPALVAGRGDVIAAMLTATPERRRLVTFVHGSAKVNEVVVANAAVADLAGVDDLAGKQIHVLRGSSYAEHLRDLSRSLVDRGRKPIDIREADPLVNTEGILELVNAGVVSYTVADDYRARLWQDLLPDIRVLEHLKVAEDTRVGWAARPSNKDLIRTLQEFARSVKQGSQLGNVLLRRYYENTPAVKNSLAGTEMEKLRPLLALFEKYGRQYGFDPLAIAAQGYQESQLDHRKTSPRGATGIMQVLPSTAGDANVGITGISNLENNIHAGVKYLAFLRDQYFSDPAITEEDRLALCWAAYNAGPGNVRKMRALAEQMGLDPDRWFNHVEVAAGRVTGRETVRYVANIYKYYVLYSMVAELNERRGS